jgi:hypothetical protein
MTGEVKPGEEIWTYIGVRLNGDALAETFLDAEGRELMFAAKRGRRGASVVGGRYRIKAERTDEGRVSASFGSAAYIGSVGAEQAAGWRLEDGAARTAYDALYREAKARKENSDLGSLTLFELRTAIRKAPTPLRRAMLAQAFGYLGL